MTTDPGADKAVQALPETLARKLADHIEHRLRTWRQQHMNRSGDRLALDDFMGEDSIADLVDFVCDEYEIAALTHRQQCVVGQAGTVETPCDGCSDTERCIMYGCARYWTPERKREAGELYAARRAILTAAPPAQPQSEQEV